MCAHYESPLNKTLLRKHFGINLPSPTSDSTHITQAANAIIKRIYRPGFKYAKAGVMLMDLQPEAHDHLSWWNFDEVIN